MANPFPRRDRQASAAHDFKPLPEFANLEHSLDFSLFNAILGHTEFRSPCGAAVGQMAINYDGQVYTCDEGRMLANMGDNTFCLGDVDNTYEELVSSPAAHAACTSSCVETLPLCRNCAYHPFCSVCPVVTYSTENDLVAHDADNYHCAIAKGILRYLFKRIKEADEDELEILFKWARFSGKYSFSF